MRRRRFLSLAGALPIAAAFGGPRATPIAGSSRRPPNGRSQVGTDGLTPNGDVLVERVPAELVEYERFGETSLAVRGVLENVSGRTLSYVEADASFLDEANTIVGEGYSNITPLPPGRGWKYNVDYYSAAGVPASEVVGFEFSVAYTEGDGRPGSPDLDVVESTLVDIEEFGDPTKAVRGTVRNVGEATIEYVEVEAHFLDADAVVVGDFFTNTDSLRPGQGWRFQVDYYAETDTPAAEIVDYDLYVGT